MRNLHINGGDRVRGWHSVVYDFRALRSFMREFVISLGGLFKDEHA